MLPNIPRVSHVHWWAQPAEADLIEQCMEIGWKYTQGLPVSSPQKTIVAALAVWARRYQMWRVFRICFQSVILLILHSPFVSVLISANTPGAGWSKLLGDESHCVRSDTGTWRDREWGARICCGISWVLTLLKLWICRNLLRVLDLTEGLQWKCCLLKACLSPCPCVPGEYSLTRSYLIWKKKLHPFGFSDQQHRLPAEGILGAIFL